MTYVINKHAAQDIRHQHTCSTRRMTLVNYDVMLHVMAFVTALHVVMVMRHALAVTRVCVVTVLPHVWDGTCDDTARRDGHASCIGCYPCL